MTTGRKPAPHGTIACFYDGCSCWACMDAAKGWQRGNCPRDRGAVDPLAVRKLDLGTEKLNRLMAEVGQ